MIIKKDLELVSRSHFPYNFFIKCFLFFYYINWSNFITRLCLCPRFLRKMHLCFMLKHLMTSWHLNIWKVKIWLSWEQEELSKWNKKRFALFEKCFHLNLKKKPAKLQLTQALSHNFGDEENCNEANCNSLVPLNLPY